MNKAETVSTQLRAMAEACGWLLKETDSGTWVASRGAMTLALPPMRQWNERKLNTIVMKLQRYGDPSLVVRWREQQARLDERNRADRADRADRAVKGRLTPDTVTDDQLTHGIQVPDRLRRAVADYAERVETEHGDTPVTVDTRPGRADIPPVETTVSTEVGTVGTEVGTAVVVGEPVPAVTGDAPVDVTSPQRAAPNLMAAQSEKAIPRPAPSRPQVGGLPLNPATLLEFFRNRPHRLVTLNELVDHFDVDVKKAQRAVSGQINRNLLFRDAIIVHHPGWLWEWGEDPAAPAAAPPDVAAVPHPTAAVNDDRAEVRRLRAELAQHRQQLAERDQQLALREEQLAARRQEQLTLQRAAEDLSRQLVDTRADHQKLIDNVTAAQELLKGLLQ